MPILFTVIVFGVEIHFPYLSNGKHVFQRGTRRFKGALTLQHTRFTSFFLFLLQPICSMSSRGHFGFVVLSFNMNTGSERSLNPLPLWLMLREPSGNTDFFHCKINAGIRISHREWSHRHTGWIVWDFMSNTNLILKWKKMECMDLETWRRRFMTKKKVRFHSHILSLCGKRSRDNLFYLWLKASMYFKEKNLQ